MKTKISFAVMFILFSSIAFAGAPGIPNAFYGTVNVNGAPAADGTTVTAKIGGLEVASSVTSGGQYGYPIGSFYIPDPDLDLAGKTITFFVNGVDTGITAVFVNGEVTLLDLSATIATTTTVGGSSGGSGGSGGSSATTTSVATTTTVSAVSTTEECQEQWKCSEWSACKDGLETRMCYDENSCGTDMDKPFESQPCSVQEAQSTNSITALVIGALSDPLTVIIIIVLVIIVAYFVWRMLKKKK